MAFDFAEFDKQVNMEEIDKQISEAQDFEDLPKGEYIVRIDKMELGATKKDSRPMFTATLKVVEGKYKNRLIFFNRVVFGTKNDGSMIKSVCTWISKLLDSDDPIKFKGYQTLADDILDVFQEVSDSVEVKIEYDPDAFNSVKIVEVYDI